MATAGRVPQGWIHLQALCGAARQAPWGRRRIGCASTTRREWKNAVVLQRHACHQKMLCENHSMEEDGGAVPRAIPLMFPMQEHPAVSKLLPSRLGAQAKSPSDTKCATTNSTTETVARKNFITTGAPKNPGAFSTSRYCETCTTCTPEASTLLSIYYDCERSTTGKGKVQK